MSCPYFREGTFDVSFRFDNTIWFFLAVFVTKVSAMKPLAKKTIILEHSSCIYGPVCILLLHVLFLGYIHVVVYF